MFESLTGRLEGIFKKLTGRGGLSDASVEETLRELRVALL
nr:signal recognition particle receptor subunit alpha [Nitrospiraceae bacterium]